MFPVFVMRVAADAMGALAADRDQLALYDIASRSVVGSFPARAVKAVAWTPDSAHAALVSKRSVTLLDHRMLEVS